MAGLRGDRHLGIFSWECRVVFSLDHVQHIYYFDFWWKFLLFPSVLLGRLVLVFTWCILHLVYGVELVGLLEDPTFSVGMISGLARGTMYLTYLVQNFVEAGWFIPGAFSGRLLTWLGAFQSGIYYRALRAVFIVASMLVFVASWPAVAISGFGVARVARDVASTS